ncbi:hypothetical protein ACWC4A_47210 [Streptomyces mirabilis]
MRSPAPAMPWRFLTKIRIDAQHSTTRLRAPLVLANTEIHR